VFPRWPEVHIQGREPFIVDEENDLSLQQHNLLSDEYKEKLLVSLVEVICDCF
jgi:hypothetical protein